mgnify:CR=1 FL=1
MVRFTMLPIFLVIEPIVPTYVAIHELPEKQACYVASNYCLDETQEKMAHTEQLEIESAFE